MGTISSSNHQSSRPPIVWMYSMGLLLSFLLFSQSWAVSTVILGDLITWPSLFKLECSPNQGSHLWQYLALTPFSWKSWAKFQEDQYLKTTRRLKQRFYHFMSALGMALHELNQMRVSRVHIGIHRMQSLAFTGKLKQTEPTRPRKGMRNWHGVREASAASRFTNFLIMDRLGDVRTNIYWEHVDDGLEKLRHLLGMGSGKC